MVVMSKNVFSNSSFFARYMELRKDLNHNDLLEHPEMMRLLGNIEGKSVLDLGCGSGSYAKEFISKGSSSYLGIDSSSLMIEKAKEDVKGDNISFRLLPLEKLGELSESFDIAYSSLVFHYIEDFEKLSKDIYNALNDNGVLLFSQMHPLLSATPAYQGYFLGDFFAFSSYQQEGRRDGKWFNEHVVSYHRRLSSIISTLSRSGFFVENVVEPIPSEEALMEFSKLQRDLVRPTFLIVKARKITSFSCS